MADFLKLFLHFLSEHVEPRLLLQIVFQLVLIPHQFFKLFSLLTKQLIIINFNYFLII
jgi:hypothetical protein